MRDALADLDQRWIVSASRRFHRRDVKRITVVANDHTLRLDSHDPRKLWRMPRPALTALHELRSASRSSDLWERR